MLKTVKQYICQYDRRTLCKCELGWRECVKSWVFVSVCYTIIVLQAVGIEPFQDKIAEDWPALQRNLSAPLYKWYPLRILASPKHKNHVLHSTDVRTFSHYSIATDICSFYSISNSLPVVKCRPPDIATYILGITNTFYHLHTSFETHVIKFHIFLYNFYASKSHVCWNVNCGVFSVDGLPNCSHQTCNVSLFVAGSCPLVD